ncbi:cation:proton antiporter [archaeon]|nr:cation:proton antiporter [archaeon]
MDFTIVITNLIVLLLLAKLLGELCERIKFPSVLGYIIAGIIAGPMLFGALMAGTVTPTIGNAQCAPAQYSADLNQ